MWTSQIHRRFSMRTLDFLTTNNENFLGVWCLTIIFEEEQLTAESSWWWWWEKPFLRIFSWSNELFNKFLFYHESSLTLYLTNDQKFKKKVIELLKSCHSRLNFLLLKYTKAKEIFVSEKEFNVERWILKDFQ